MYQEAWWGRVKVGLRACTCPRGPRDPHSAKACWELLVVRPFSADRSVEAVEKPRIANVLGEGTVCYMPRPPAPGLVLSAEGQSRSAPVPGARGNLFRLFPVRPYEAFGLLCPTFHWRFGPFLCSLQRCEVQLAQLLVSPCHWPSPQILCAPGGALS